MIWYLYLSSHDSPLGSSASCGSEVLVKSCVRPFWICAARHDESWRSVRPRCSAPRRQVNVKHCKTWKSQIKKLSLGGLIFNRLRSANWSSWTNLDPCSSNRRVRTIRSVFDQSHGKMMCSCSPRMMRQHFLPKTWQIANVPDVPC